MSEHAADTLSILHRNSLFLVTIGCRNSLRRILLCKEVLEEFEVGLGVVVRSSKGSIEWRSTGGCVVHILDRVTNPSSVLNIQLSLSAYTAPF
jgi:hypothetical protein